MPKAPTTLLSPDDLKKAVYVRRLVCYDVTKNNKKFWYGYVLPGGTYVAEFGMVDITCTQTEPKHFGSESAAKAEVDKNAKKKLGYGGDKAPYQELKVIESSAASHSALGSGKVVSGASLANVALQQIQHNCPEVAELIRFLANSNRHKILANTKMTFDESAGTFRTPLGIVTMDAIDEARRLLNTIGDYTMKRQWDNPTLIRSVNSYLMNIPQNVGTKLEIQSIFPDSSALQKQSSLLDSLEASVQAVMAPKTPDCKVTSKDAAEKVFSVKLIRIDDGKTIDACRKLYTSTRKDMHVCKHLNVKSVYDVEIESANAGYARDGAKIGGEVEAWHGTNHANILSILKGGLVVPPSSSPHVCGRMFGDGVYGAIDSTKSLNYAYGYWDGSRNERCFMFRMTMAMGKHYTPSGPGSHRPHGYDSIWAKARSSGVQNDELIVPRASQVKLLRLMEFTPNGK